MYDLSACTTSVFPEAEAFQGTASWFFNTKVHVSNQTERILTLLMTGLTFRDWHSHVNNRSLGVIPPNLSIHGLNKFEYRYGRTPDIVQLAHPEIFVEGFLARLKLDDVFVCTLAADGGVVTNSIFQVLTTKVDALCKKWNLQSKERFEP